jgi:hypothetical protein
LPYGLLIALPSHTSGAAPFIATWSANCTLLSGAWGRMVATLWVPSRDHAKAETHLHGRPPFINARIGACPNYRMRCPNFDGTGRRVLAPFPSGMVPFDLSAGPF